MQLAYLLALNNVYSEQYPKYANITEEMYQCLDIDLPHVDNALDFGNLQLIGALAVFSPSSLF
jgi:hypothetical protein